MQQQQHESFPGELLLAVPFQKSPQFSFMMWKKPDMCIWVHGIALQPLAEDNKGTHLADSSSLQATCCPQEDICTYSAESSTCRSNAAT